MMWVYWKSTSGDLSAGPDVTAGLTHAVLADLGFVTDDKSRRASRFTATMANRLPGMPFNYIWTAVVRGGKGSSSLDIEHGLGATPATWVFLGIIMVALIAMIIIAAQIQEAWILPMLPILWLGGCVVAMKLRQARLERQLWQALGEKVSVSNRSSTVRAVS